MKIVPTICVALIATVALLGAPGVFAADSDTVARVGSTTISASDLESLAAGRLHSMRMKLANEEYEVKSQILEDLISKQLLENEARSRGITVSELTKVEIEGKASAVTPEEVKQFYETNKARYGTRTEEDVLKLIEPSLRQQRVNQRRADYIDELRGNGSVKVLLDAPRVDVVIDGDPIKGNSEAPVTIVEFSDFECPYCSRVNPTLKQVEETYGDKVRIVFRDFPLQFHKQAQKAAEAAECAHEQGKFWEMHDALFQNQRALQPENLKAYATDLSLDAAKFGQCLDSGKFAQEVRKDLSEGSSYGVTGTPAFFINGRFLSGAQPFRNFSKIIDEELDRLGVEKDAKPAS